MNPPPVAPQPHSPDARPAQSESESESAIAAGRQKPISMTSDKAASDASSHRTLAPGGGQRPGLEPLDPNARWHFRLNQLLIAMAGWVPLMLFARRPLSDLLGDLGPLAVGLATLGLALAWAWRMGDRRHRAVGFRLDEGGLSIHSGLYWQSQSHVPRSRVQHTDIQRGPLDRRLGLADLLVHTAGTQMATVRLAGVSAERAQALRDALLEGHDQQF